MALPATMIFAPAWRTSLLVSALMPPSTSRAVGRRAVHLDITVNIHILNRMIEHMNFLQLRLDEFLSAKARINGHDEDHVYISYEFFNHSERCARIKGNAYLASSSSDLLNDPVMMTRCLHMECDDIRTSLSVGKGNFLQKGQGGAVQHCAAGITCL